jgi:hypothetical protein
MKYNYTKELKYTPSKTLIKEIIGKQYLMLNAVLLSKLGAEASVFLTLLLDKADFFERSDQITGCDTDGFYLYRTHISNETTLTPHQQRKVEGILTKQGLIRVVEERNDTGNKRNRYYINLEELYEFIKQKPC